MIRRDLEWIGAAVCSVVALVLLLIGVSVEIVVSLGLVAAIGGLAILRRDG